MFGRIALALSLCSLAIAVAARASDEGSAGHAYGAQADWRNHGGGVDESGYSALRDISKASISRMGLAWCAPGRARRSAPASLRPRLCRSATSELGMIWWILG